MDSATLDPREGAVNCGQSRPWSEGGGWEEPLSSLALLGWTRNIQGSILPLPPLSFWFSTAALRERGFGVKSSSSGTWGQTVTWPALTLDTVFSSTACQLRYLVLLGRGKCPVRLPGSIGPFGSSPLVPSGISKEEKADLAPKANTIRQAEAASGAQIHSSPTPGPSH